MVHKYAQQNGVAEWVNRTIEEHATAMLYKAGLLPSFLGEAVNAYVMIQNKCPTNSLHEKIPLKLWYRHKLDI